MKNMSNPLKMSKMKKAIAILAFALASLTAAAQTSVWEGERTMWTHGEGTESDPYLIESADNLAFLAYMVNKGFETSGMHFRLTTDIDLNGRADNPWTPIGLGDRWFNEDGCDRGPASSLGFTPNTLFRGHFDGGAHYISNLYVDEDFVNAGLFGCIEGVKNDDTIVPAVIENVFVTNGFVKGTHVGGIVGKGNYLTEVAYCWNGATIEGSNVGGIVGNDVGTVRNCYNLGTLSGIKVGGIVGNKASAVFECYNAGTLSGEGVNVAVGGLIGFATGGFQLSNCYNTGSLSAIGTSNSGPFVGGLAGLLSSGEKVFTNSYNVGEVSSTNYIDGLIGYLSNNTYLDIENCYYLGTLVYSEFGTPASADDMRQPFFVDLLNLENDEPIWGMDEDNLNDGFPILTRNNLAVNEIKESRFSVYPNPSHGQFTVEGSGQLRISNLMGQRISACEIDGRQTFSLPKGMYFITLNGKTAKVVIE